MNAKAATSTKGAERCVNALDKQQEQETLRNITNCIGSAFVLAFLFVLPFYAHLTVAQESATPTIREIARLGRGTATSLSWRPDGKVLAVGSGTGVWLYDADLEILVHMGEIPIRSISWSSDGEKLATADEEGKVQTWHILDDDYGYEVETIANDGRAAAWSPVADKLALAGLNSTSIMNFATGETRVIYRGNSRKVTWSPDGTKLAVLSLEPEIHHQIRIWNLESGEPLYSLPTDGSGAMAWSPDGQMIVTGLGCCPSYIQVWNAATGASVADLEVSYGPFSDVMDVA